MRYSLALAVLTAPSVLAFPWLRPEGMETLLNHPEAQAEIKRRFAEYEAGQTERLAPRQANTGLIPGLVSLLGGTLQAVLDPVFGLLPTNDAVNGLKKFPEGRWSTSIGKALLIFHQRIILSRLQEPLTNVDHALA
jgi:hypothetical protein